MGGAGHERKVGLGVVLRVGVLGPVTAWYGHDELHVGQPRQQAVLGILAMRANRVISRAELVDAVWGHDPPASAEGGIYTYVAGLRRIIEPGRSLRGPGRVLVSSGAGYVLHLVPGPRGDQHATRPAQGPAGLDDAPEAGHVGVDTALGAGGRILSPDRVDEFAPGDHPVRAHREDAEDGLLPGLTHMQFIVAVPCRYRAEHADAQHHGFADLPFVTVAPHPEASSSKVTVICAAHPEKIQIAKRPRFDNWPETPLR